MISLLLTFLLVGAFCAAAQQFAVRVLHTQTVFWCFAFLRRSAVCAGLSLFAQMCVLDSFSAILSGWPAVLVAASTAALFWVCRLACAFAHGKSYRMQAAVALPVLLLCALWAEGFVWNAKTLATAQLTGTPAQTVFTDATSNTDARLTQLLYENIGADVQNIHLAVGTVFSQRKLDALAQGTAIPPEELLDRPVTVRLFVIDAAGARELALTERTVVYPVPSSHYLTLHLSAPVQSIRVELDAPWYCSPILLSQGLNVRVPLHISPVRVLILFALGALCWLLRPHSFVWAYTLNLHKKRQRVYLALVAAACVAVLWGAALLNTGFYVNPQLQDAQYQELARSLASGKTTIGEAPAFLAQMENPYDTALRDELAAVYEPDDPIGYRFDVAYFEGNYYVYFGVVPVLLFYLPFYLLTGHDMPNILASLALLPFLVGGVWALLYRFTKRCCSKIPAALYACVCVMVSLCSSVMFLAKRPDFYALPITAALVFTLWGLFFWLTALEAPTAQGRLHSGLLLAGSLCMALVAGCRPQMILCSALAIPIFWHSAFYERTLFSKKGFSPTLCIAAPYVLVAAGLMAYNFVRFGSPLEFGAQFNLTVADMTHRGLVFGRTAQGLFQYLLQPPAVSAVFPFVQPADSAATYLGYVFDDPPFGGLLICNPFLWTLALLPVCRAALRKHRLYGFTLTALGAAFAIVLADVQMGGVLQRYFSDFGVLFFLAAALVALVATGQDAVMGTDSPHARALLSTASVHTTERISTLLRTALLCAMVASLVYSILTVYMGDMQALRSMNPTRFYAALHGVCFWV